MMFLRSRVFIALHAGTRFMDIMQGSGSGSIESALLEAASVFVGF